LLLFLLYLFGLILCKELLRTNELAHCAAWPTLWQLTAPTAALADLVPILLHHVLGRHVWVAEEAVHVVLDVIGFYAYGHVILSARSQRSPCLEHELVDLRRRGRVSEALLTLEERHEGGRQGLFLC